MKNLTAIELAQKIKAQKVSCEEAVLYYISQIEKYHDKNAVIEVFEDAIDVAKDMDKKLKAGKTAGKLFGVPILIKDNILFKGHNMSAGSNFLKDFKSIYTATALSKLLDEGVIVLGRCNMDEFAMGSSTEHSIYGRTKNAFDDDRIAGGSSGGSAVAVALDMCAFALGTDTGGSIRQPSSYNGVFGIKPTYGAVSRYGAVAYASSLEQIGPITKDINDNILVLSIMQGKDINDNTTIDNPDINIEKVNKIDACSLRVGVISELEKTIKNSENCENFDKICDFLSKNGIKIEKISIPHYEYCLPSYYILASAEATSNLGRFDGVKYTHRSEITQNIDDVYYKSRSEGFGLEVKRRIMLGNFVLSSGYFDAYYQKARKVQRLIRNEFISALQKVDILIFPATFGEAFLAGEKTNDPVAMYAEDLFTISANITSLPCLCVPYAKGKNNLPLGLQLLSNYGCEDKIYSLAKFIETKAGMKYGI